VQLQVQRKVKEGEGEEVR